jgi:hypothetical protein
MKRITKKDIVNGFKWCDQCLLNNKKVIATYKDYGSKYCEEHKYLIYDPTNEHLTEADYKSWMKL